MCPRTSVNGRAWPASASRVSSASTLSSELQELADGVGRVADVEVLRHAAEQVVAGDQQPPLGLVQADVRRRVAGRLDDVSTRPTSDSTTTPSTRSRSARSVAGLAGALPAAKLGPAAQRLLGHAALERDLDPAVEVGVRVQRPRRVHPDLAARAFGEQRRLAAVIRVRVRDDDQPDVLDPVPDLVERALEMGHRARLVHAGVDEHESVAGAQRPRIDVRHAGEVDRHPQPPDAGQHAFPRPTSRGRVGLRGCPTGGRSYRPRRWRRRAPP